MRMQHRAAILHEGDHDHREERHQRDEHDGPAVQGRERAPPAARVDKRRSAPGSGGEAPTSQIAALDDDGDRRRAHQQHSQHAGRSGVGVRFAHEQLEGFHRHDRLVLRQHERDPKVFQRLDEYQERAREYRGDHQGQGNRPEASPARGSEILARFLHRHINRLEAGHRRQQDIRIERQHIDQHDSRGPIDRSDRDAERLQCMGDDAGMAKQQDERIGAHETGQHERQHGKRHERRLAANRQPRDGKGKWRGDRGGRQGREHGYGQTVDYAVAIEGAGSDLRIVVQREGCSTRIEKAGAENAIQRVDQKKTEKAERNSGDDEWKCIAGQGDAHDALKPVTRRGSYASVSAFPNASVSRG